MLSVVEKSSMFIGKYFCVYLDDWLILQTKSSTVANQWLTAKFLAGARDAKQPDDNAD